MTTPFPASVAVAVMAAAVQIGGQTRAPEPPDPAREYPSFEGMLTYVVRDEARTRRADDALRSAPSDATTIRLLLQLKRTEDALKALEAASRGPLDNLIDAMVSLGEYYGALTEDPARTYTDRVATIVVPVRARLAMLPREDAARLARALVRIDYEQAKATTTRPAWDLRMNQFVQEYRGTREALMAEVDLIEHRVELPGKIAALEEFWRAHPASEAGAKALYQKGYQLAHNVGMSGTEPRAADPTERFLQVVGIADELGSGRYPDSEWVRRAPLLVSGFYVSETPPPAYQPGNVDHLLAEYQRFARKHFAVDEAFGGSVRYVITSRIVGIHARQGIDRVTSVERTLANLEAAGADKRAVALFRAEYLAELAAGEREIRGASRSEAEAALAALAADGTDFVARRATATLAGLRMYHRDYQRALPVFQGYASRFPESPFAWVALVRAGQCFMELGDAAQAAREFEAAASSAPPRELPYTVGAALAGQAYDALGQFDRSLGAYRRALASWNLEYWRDALPPPAQVRRPGPVAGASSQRRAVTRRNLANRVVSLEQTIPTNVGLLLERAAIQIDARQFLDARTTLEAARKQARSVDDQVAVRVLDHRAQLEMALDLVAVDAPTRNEPAGLRALQAISAQPFDTSVGFASLTRAGVLFKNGAEEHARMLMTSTLDAWRDSQRALRAEGPSSPVAADVIAIRTTLLRPAGVFELVAKSSFSHFRVASTIGYSVINPDVVIVTKDGTASELTVYQDFPELPKVVFWTTDDIAVVRRLGATLAGAGPRTTANSGIRDFWNSFFAIRNNHDGRWVEETYPRIVSIRFLDEERSRAAVAIATGYEGATVLMEKRNGTWHVMKITNVWIS